MLYDFHQGKSANQATKDICQAYGEGALEMRLGEHFQIFNNETTTNNLQTKIP